MRFEIQEIHNSMFGGWRRVGMLSRQMGSEGVLVRAARCVMPLYTAVAARR